MIEELGEVAVPRTDLNRDLAVYKYENDKPPIPAKAKASKSY